MDNLSPPHSISGVTCSPDTLVPTPIEPLDWNMSDRFSGDLVIKSII